MVLQMDTVVVTDAKIVMGNEHRGEEEEEEQQEEEERELDPLGESCCCPPPCQGRCAPCCSPCCPRCCMRYCCPSTCCMGCCALFHTCCRGSCWVCGVSRKEAIRDYNTYMTPVHSLCGWDSMHALWPNSTGPTHLMDGVMGSRGGGASLD